MAAVLRQWNRAADEHINDPHRGLRIQLVDVSTEYPLLSRRPGLLRWPVMALVPGSETVMHAYATWPEYVARVGATIAAGTGDSKDGCIVESMFSPLTDEDGHALGLQRCIRVWPHNMDTGGFFAAVLCKETPEQWAARTGNIGAATKAATASPPVSIGAGDVPVLAKKERRRERSQFKIEDRLVRMTVAPWWTDLRRVYGIHSDIMTQTGIMVRHDQATSMGVGTGRVYIATLGAAELLTLAHQSDTFTGHPHLKVVNSGVQIFEPPATRGKDNVHMMSTDGVRWLLPYLSLSTGTGGKGTTRCWLIDRSKLGELVAATRLPMWNIGSPELQATLKLPTSQGRIILYCNNDSSDSSDDSKSPARSSSSSPAVPSLPYAVMCSNDSGQITVCANKHELWAIRALLES